VKLFSLFSDDLNVRDHNKPTLQTDGQTTCIAIAYCALRSITR